MKTKTIRALRRDEIENYCKARLRLFPDGTPEEFRREVRELLDLPERFAILVCVDENDKLLGFIEMSLREELEDLPIHYIGYIEGWFVEKDHRREGVGRLLVEAGEKWSREKGCGAMGSDALIDNHLSRKAHRAPGYSEKEEVVIFRKQLSARGRT